MVRTMLALLVLGVGCGGNAKNNPKTDGAEQPVPAPEPAPAPPPEPVATPQALYDECRERVEGVQKADECKTDADCATAGCGSEVCTTTAEAANVMTACEDKLCFKILDVCGCHDGQCTWTLKAEVPASQVPVAPSNRLPSSLPPTKAPAEGEGEKKAE